MLSDIIKQILKIFYDLKYTKLKKARAFLFFTWIISRKENIFNIKLKNHFMFNCNVFTFHYS